jgi:FMN-dependent oxidoreductase (nitrilotriacetate monooxygenase family)
VNSGRNEKIVITAALMHGLGMSYGAWIHRDGEPSDYLGPQHWIDMARKAESGKLHALFLAETITNAEWGLQTPCGSMDTAIVLSLMAAATSRIGLVGTASTTYNQPYELARRFATLDHLSRGRAGWNVVTTYNSSVAKAFGMPAHPEHDDRYARAAEFIEVARELWDTYEEGALVGDKAKRVFIDPDRVHDINHHGEFYDVEGRLPFSRSPQGRPVIFEAGSSPVGRDLAARTADVVFTAQHTIESAVEFRADIRARAAEYGRDPDTIKVLPGMVAILGATEEQAQARKEALDEAAGVVANLRQLAGRTGMPIETLELDKPFPVHLMPPDSEYKGSVGFRRSLVDLAVKENLTVGDLLKRTSGAVHHQMVGTPAQIVDAMQERLDAGAADGFTMMVDELPSGVDDVVDLLVPELRARGLFHEDYEHETLRANLGIDVPQLAPTS